MRGRPLRAYTLLALITLHVVGALKHRFVDKDRRTDVLPRMIELGADPAPTSYFQILFRSSKDPSRMSATLHRLVALYQGLATRSQVGSLACDPDERALHGCKEEVNMFGLANERRAHFK
jgi:hypothetical protein